jgi:hypothetical protein
MAKGKETLAAIIRFQLYPATYTEQVARATQALQAAGTVRAEDLGTETRLYVTA